VNENESFWAIIAIDIAGLVAISTVSPTAGIVFFCVFTLLAGWWHQKTYSFRSPRRH
jgi:hypothetical protein